MAPKNKPESAVEYAPSSRDNPYVTEEMQGMDMEPKVMGPPAYGSPDPNTAAGQLLPIEDHPFTQLSKGEAQISDDYGADAGVRYTEIVDGEEDEKVSDDANATEAAVELANEQGIDISEVKGTGVDGRVLKSDVEDHVEANN